MLIRRSLRAVFKLHTGEGSMLAHALVTYLIAIAYPEWLAERFSSTIKMLRRLKS